MPFNENLLYKCQCAPILNTYSTVGTGYMIGIKIVDSLLE